MIRPRRGGNAPSRPGGRHSTRFGLALLLAALGRPSADAGTTRTAPGFAVELVYTVPRESEGSWVALAADPAGRLYASDQYGPLYRLTLPPAGGGAASARRLPLGLGGVHGLTWIGGDLYAVVAQAAVHPPGLYRLRDTDGDGELDQVLLLRRLEGDGEHGPHAVMPAPDGKSLFILAGNATARPELARSRVPPHWGEDALFAPVPAVVGSEARGRLGGGWIARTDFEGKSWELVTAGLRNAYALAVDDRGEIFTFDSDTELELNLPWYRPTRVVHAVSGADFGWRRGVYKVPAAAPDGWSALRPMGLGSPTAVLFPRGARIPAAYRSALWVADWSYGRITALHLRPDGATFTASPEEIVAGVPLPVTALCVNPADGALYFATGGRRTSSAIYRLHWIGDPRRAAEPDRPPDPIPTAVGERKALEEFHGRIDPAAVDGAWPALASPDPIVRRAARTALESQPVATWRDRALRETSPRTALPALLALARVDARANQSVLLAALRRLLVEELDAALRAEAVRGLYLTFSRGGELAAAERMTWATQLAPLLEAGPAPPDEARLELLLWLRAPGALERGFALLASAATREAQLDCARLLRSRRADWNAGQRRAYLAWLHQTGTWRGGPSFTLFLKELRREAVASAPPGEQADLEASLAASAARPTGAPPGNRGPGRAWSVAELAAATADQAARPDPARGRRVFGQAGCFACHTFRGEGGAVGPDLTGVGSRLAPRDLIEAIVEPSREISDQYGTSLITLRDGRQLSGRIINYTEQGLHLAENLFDPAQAVRLPEKDIIRIEAATLSLMPPGLLNGFDAGEIMDLLAFLRDSSAGR